jgi:disulfide bond formation protein DsbB
VDKLTEGHYMLFKQCNIDKTDRINRVVIGAILFFAALIGMSRIFFLVVGIVLVAEGLIGWCSIPYLIRKIQK